MSVLNIIVSILVSLVSVARGGLLGAGTGEGSCAAPPFRAVQVQWSAGCPSFASCCSEYGFCRPIEEWQTGNFRDCNGVSNGVPLPPETLEAEAAAPPHHGKPAGEVGPPPDPNLSLTIVPKKNLAVHSGAYKLATSHEANSYSAPEHESSLHYAKPVEAPKKYPTQPPSPSYAK